MIYKKINKETLKTFILSEYSNIRKLVSKQKNRGEISFSNKKPWKQKGTGNARSGRKSSPLWRKGGRSFPNGNENFKKKINKKVFFLAKMNILFSKKIFILENLNSFYFEEKSIFIYEKKKFQKIFKKNNVSTIDIKNFKIINILKYNNLIFTKKSFRYFI
ncbi:50S ribosomal protein L4 [Candidatus Vidania fulgoroideae]|uniref:Large ribosomal subunit protein uL4 n=1 Tax=Candidatus Vidania fulgoroideorum TaxID=881286 RepID=A0AAX3NBD7_9PROT|nr:50S ribosomal protein L4 [Candidatus Vidania fulgoroideae]WDR79463.1 50S ribosomal protein L4 [Candidatus Vidania fulgoroideae]